MSTAMQRFRVGITSLVWSTAAGFHRHWRPGRETHRPTHLRVMPDHNEQQRALGLKGACELLADGFDDLDRYIADYIHEVPLQVGGGKAEDVERFLQWLARRDDVSEEQRDFIVCQRARQAVEFVALARRLAHARFQLLLKSSCVASVPDTRPVPDLTERWRKRPGYSHLREELELNRRLTVHLNPVHVWATLETPALLEEGEPVPATVLFFPVGDEVRSAVVDEEVQQLVQALAHGPRRVKQIAQRTELPVEIVIDLLTELAELGLVGLSAVPAVSA